MSRVFRPIIASNAVFPLALALLTGYVIPRVYQVITYRSLDALAVLLIYETSIVFFILLWLLIARAAARLRGWPFFRAARITGLFHAAGLLLLPYALDFSSAWNRWGALLAPLAFGLTAVAVLACLLPPLLIGRRGWRPLSAIVLAAGIALLVAATVRENHAPDAHVIRFLLVFQTALVILFSGAYVARSFTGHTRRLLMAGIPVLAIALLAGGYSVLSAFRRHPTLPGGTAVPVVNSGYDRGGFGAESAPPLRRVQIADEYRDGLPAGGSLRFRSLEPVNRGATLEAGFGIIPLRPGPLPGPDAFRLVIGDAARDTVIILRPRGRAGRAWTDVTIPLDRFAGARIDLELRFDAEGVEGEDPVVAPYWSPPRIRDPSAWPAEPPNLLLITIDALRADHVGCYGYDRPTTPNLDRLADEGVLFAHAVTQAPYTLPATASILSALYPMTHRVGYGRSLRGIRTLPLILHDRGYRTAAFADNPWLNPQHGFDIGFERYVLNAPPTDPAVDRRIREWLRTADRPFFLWLHYLAPHAPYRAHPEFFSLIGRDPFRAGVMFPAEEVERYKDPDRELPPGRIDDIIDLYDGEIWFADRSIGGLLRYLGELGVLERTVVAVTSDHGEEFKDHQGMGHSDTLFDELIRVPLLLRYPPSLPAGRVVEDAAVETIDLFPTLLDLLGIQDGRPPIEGESLLATASGGAIARPSIAFSDRPPGWLKCVTDGEYKLLRTTGNRLLRIPWGYRRDRLYDLRADPRETTDRIRGEPAVADRLREEMSAIIARSDRIRQELQTGHQETIEFNEDLIEQMKALGYIQ